MNGHTNIAGIPPPHRKGTNMVLMVNGEHVTEAWVERKCMERGLPLGMAIGLYLYLAHHIEPGRFLRAVLSNDFRMAVANADTENRRCLLQWAQLLYCDLPANSFGSHEAVMHWLTQRKAK